jgi:anaerobic magnesium-protoporphyrin IX monomethyl ester cyclase
MRVLLIDPPGDLIALNLGLGYLTPVVIQAGHELKILDLNNYRVAHPDLLIKRVISSFQPDVVGFSIMSLTSRTVKTLVNKIRDYYSGWCVAGGVHVTIEREHVWDEIEGIDFLITGEGEHSLPALLQALDNHGEFNEIDGLLYRKDGHTLRNQGSQPIHDLDSLPWPDFRIAGVTSIERYPLLTSRGCPYSCIYCASPVLCQRKWRYRQPNFLIDELRHAEQTYHSTSFAIMDDNFTLMIDRAIEFCDLLIKSRLGLPWECLNGIRADKVNEELILKMKEAGCYRVSIGVESLIPEIFEGIKKGESINEILHAVKLFKKAGIEVHGFFLVGLPGDNYQATLGNFRLAKKIGLDKGIWQLVTPFPGTALSDWVKANATQLLDYRDVNPARDISFETADYPKHERSKAFLQVSIPNNQFPLDINQSKLQNLFRIISLSLRYDAKHIHSHLWWLLKNGLSILIKGITRTSARIEMDPRFYDNFERLD